MSTRIPAVLLLLSAFTPAFGDVTTWDFDVYLDDRKIGTHRFEVSEAGGERQVRSEARFDYRILFIPAYRYEHHNTERWRDNCLIEFAARTDTNGELIEVSGEHRGQTFHVDRGEIPLELPACVMSFAYWNPDFLEQSRLLNPQTGEYVAVVIEDHGEERFHAGGRELRAKRYRLTAYETDLTLWYSPERQWLGLESIARGGRVIRYELS